MLNAFTKSAGAAVLSVAVLGLVACGESSQEKATKQVCAATTEIKTQIKKLESVPLSLSFVTEAKTSAEAIGKSVGQLKSAAPNLPAANKEEFESATKNFESELALLLATALKGATSGESALKSAESEVKASLAKLEADYKKAFEALKC